MTNRYKSKEFIYLANLISIGKVRLNLSNFFVRRSLSLWLIYKDNQTMLWIYSFFWFFTSEWFWVPFSIFLAWKFNTWWLIIVGIAFSWIVDEIMKFITYYFLPDSILRDESLLNYFWEQRPPHISILSTKEKWDDSLKRKRPIIIIIPPRSWQTIVDEFKKEDNSNK